ncbi:MAG: DUF2760 domain-containing protein [Planctomycetes bacterium]|nr:DUF2760 domain-containing protein [Planctomycetota bacterium]
MGRLGLAFGTFFRILRDAPFAQEVDRIARGAPAPAPAPVPAPPLPAPAIVPSPAPAPTHMPAPRTPGRSEALTLLALLQREARFLDFIQEPIAAYSDAQVGAAVRDVHRDCGAALERLFAIHPLASQPEGSELELPAGFDAARFRVSGNVSGPPPYRGKLRHAGWEAARCQVPEWNGGEEAARVLAASELEIT